MIKPTKEQFEDYVRIRDSGVTNMFDLHTILRLAVTELSTEHCMYIMHDDNFKKLSEEYGVSI